LETGKPSYVSLTVAKLLVSPSLNKFTYHALFFSMDRENILFVPNSSIAGADPR